jgi:hypothetical protein
VTQLKFQPPCDQCRGSAFHDGHPCKICNGRGFTIESGRTHRGYSEYKILTDQITVGWDEDSQNVIEIRDRHDEQIAGVKVIVWMFGAFVFWLAGAAVGGLIWWSLS